MKKRLGVLVVLVGILTCLVWDYNTEELVVAVIDTGVNEEGALEGDVLQGYDFANQDRVTEDNEGHGTRMAKIIAEKAPEAKILPLKIMEAHDCEFSWSTFAIPYSILRGADVVNMSFSSPKSWITEFFIKWGQTKGVVFVAASGNDGVKHAISYPANYKGVIAVGGFDQTKGDLYVSGNESEKIAFVAPSVSEDEGSTSEGTSLSAAYVSGVVGYVLGKKPDASKVEIENRLHEASAALFDTPYDLVDFERVKSTEENKVYLAASNSDPVTSQTEIDIRLDMVNAEKVVVTNNKEVIGAVLNKDNTLTIPLTEGVNQLNITASKGNEKTVVSRVVQVDFTPPVILGAHFTKEDGSYYVNVFTYDDQFTTAMIEGFDAKSVRRDLRNHTSLFKDRAEGDLHRYFDIVVTDRAGNQTREKIKIAKKEG